MQENNVYGFNISSALGRSFDVTKGNFLPFFILAAVLHIPSIVLTQILGRVMTNAIISGGDSSMLMILSLATIVLTYMTTFLASGALIYGTFQHLRGAKTSLGTCVSVGFSKLLPVFGVGLLAGLAIMGGMLLLIVPGIILTCGLWVAVPVAVVENTGLVESLKRSWALTMGYKGQIFGLLIIVGVATNILTTVMSTAAPASNMTVSMGMTSIVSIVSVVFSAVLSSVGYHDLRLSKEGVDATELESVFD